METDYSPLTVSHSHSHGYPSNGFYGCTIHCDSPTIKTGNDSTVSRQLCDGDLNQLNFDRCIRLDNLFKVLPDTLSVGDQRFGAGPKKLASIAKLLTMASRSCWFTAATQAFAAPITEAFVSAIADEFIRIRAT